ncbi:hypothetical protein ACTWP6_04870 [Mycobacterium sp. 4D054]|uniref:hypothetical protein n=1 Tax=Mycobacterium sp. 4D054 TaxID=3457440 RepID=UPI003FD20B40
MAAWGDRRIALYTLRVELDKRVFRTDDSAREPFVANFNGAGADLLTTISSFVEALPKDDHVERDMRHFGQPRDVRRSGRTISWEMDGGESGRTSWIKIRKDADQQQRERSGIEWAEFWVYAVVPKDSNQGWLLVEKDGRHTLPTAWRDELIRKFAETHHGYRLRIGTVREASLWSQVENALDDNRLIGFEVAMRSGDTTPAGAAGFERGMEKYSRQIWRTAGDPLPGRRLRIFRRQFTRNVTSDGLREVEAPIETDDLADDRFRIRLRDDVAEIKATVLNHDGKPKTVVFEGLDPQQTVVMEGTSDGHPDQGRFVSECRSTVADLAQSGGVALPPGWDTGSWEHPADAPQMEVRADESPQGGEQAEQSS